DKQKYDVLLSIVLYSLFLFSVALSPFDFELSLKAIKQKLIYDSNVIPFKAHFSARSIGAAVDIVREVLLYLPLGSLLSLYLSLKYKTLVILTVTLLYGLSIELLQVLVIGRYVDLTDCLLASLGGLIGATTAHLFASASPSVKEH
ncbi:VanZ family protein, partial [Oleiphilus sp. HI0043]|uniref:VanZ family protein n=5 Tax=Oleiphilus TaxID=141450 RepID=UPI000AF28583